MLSRLLALLIAAILLDVAPPGDDSDSGCDCNDDNVGMGNLDTKSDLQSDGGEEVDSDAQGNEQLTPTIPRRR